MGGTSVATFEFLDQTLSLAQMLARVTPGGTVGPDRMNGTLGNDTIQGLGGNDSINGLGGNDWLDGGTGADQLVGGTGDDMFIVDDNADAVVETIGEGTDTVEATVSWTLAAHVEHLVLTGSAAINATGNGIANWIEGNAADNRIDGGAGADTLLGSDGNDTYIVDATADVVTEYGGQGIDTIRSSVTWSLGANLENLTLTGTAAVNGTGNALDNALVGNAGNNVLEGIAGNDTYDAGTGADTLNDTSTTSNEVYRWGLGQGNDTISDAGGTDRIELGTGVTASQVSLTRSGNNLQVRIAGAADVLTVSNWYLSAANQIESIRLADGSVIDGRSAPLAASVAEGPARMSRQDSSAIAVSMVDSSANLDRRTNLLIEAMAQFARVDAVGSACLQSGRGEPLPYLMMPN